MPVLKQGQARERKLTMYSWGKPLGLEGRQEAWKRCILSGPGRRCPGACREGASIEFRNIVIRRWRAALEANDRVVRNSSVCSRFAKTVAVTFLKIAFKTYHRERRFTITLMLIQRGLEVASRVILKGPHWPVLKPQLGAAALLQHCQESVKPVSTPSDQCMPK